MANRSVHAVIAALFSLTAATAADINGRVLIERKLSRRTVTAAASSYNRGVAVELGSDIDNDPLAFERSHVAIYLEGQLPSKPIRATIEQKKSSLRSGHFGCPGRLIDFVSKPRSDFSQRILAVKGEDV
jgi:hypothetical protein